MAKNINIKTQNLGPLIIFEQSCANIANCEFQTQGDAMYRRSCGWTVG